MKSTTTPLNEPGYAVLKAVSSSFAVVAESGPPAATMLPGSTVEATTMFSWSCTRATVASSAGFAADGTKYTYGVLVMSPRFSVTTWLRYACQALMSVALAGLVSFACVVDSACWLLVQAARPSVPSNATAATIRNLRMTITSMVDG
jgi:hypothetical protein